MDSPLDRAVLYVSEAFENGLSQLMHPVSVERVPPSAWKNNNNAVMPESVMTVCPHCNQPSSLVTEYKGGTQTNQQWSYTMDGRCTQCDQTSSLWVISKGPKNRPHEIWMLPIPEGQRQPIKLPPNTTPERLIRTYEAAVSCFNSRIWSSSINECGRVIEGLTSDHFKTDERKALGKLVQDASKDPNSIEAKLFNPVLKLSSAVRLSRKAGSHYNFTEDPDAALAAKVLTLTEYALEYFYGLGVKVEVIRADVDALELAAD